MYKKKVPLSALLPKSNSQSIQNNVLNKITKKSLSSASQLSSTPVELSQHPRRHVKVTTPPEVSNNAKRPRNLPDMEEVEGASKRKRDHTAISGSSNIISEQSKRRRNSGTETGGSSVKPFFEQLLAENDFKMGMEDESHLITNSRKEPSMISHQLQTHFKKSTNSTEIVDSFLNGIIEYWNANDQNLKKSLLPTQVESDIETTLPKECLVRILLNVSLLQQKLIDYILEKLSDFVLVDDDDSVTWARLLTRPLAFLALTNQHEKLTEGLLNVVESAGTEVQLELITNLPDIIPDSEHDIAGEHMTKLIKKEANLTPAILDCLGNLSLSSSHHAIVKTHLLVSLRTSFRMEHIPVLAKYLLYTCEPNEMSDVIKGLRSALADFSLVEKADTAKFLTIAEIQMGLMSSKQLTPAWLKIITSITRHSDHNAVDIVVLTIIYAKIRRLRKNVESIFKKKISFSEFKIPLIEKAFEKYLTGQVFKDYLTSMIDISAALMRCKGRLVTEFAVAFFVKLFTHPEAYLHQRQEVLRSLIFLTGNEDYIKAALKVLTIMVETHPAIIQSHSLQLLNLLDRIDDAGLSDIRCIMDILCNLAFSPKHSDALSTLQDDLHILIKKQLHSCKREIKFKGIIGAVMAAKHLALVETEENFDLEAFQQKTINIYDLPSESLQQAANFIDLVIRCTKGNVEALGLAYDQLAAMLTTTSAINKCFLAWLSDAITNDFQKHFVIEEDLEDLDENLKFTMQYCINAPNEEDSKFAINIGGLCLNDKIGEMSILCLPSQFRLMRLVHYNQNENLFGIDAVLGCAVIMPDLDPDLGIDHLDPRRLKIVLDCYFHCANWFREIINAFVTQKSSDLHHKVLKRVSTLITIEETLANFMSKSGNDYQPPPSQFPLFPKSQAETSIVVGQVFKKVSKSKKIKKELNTSTATTQLSQPPAIEIVESGYVRRDCFRDLDVDILILLRDDINVVSSDSVEASESMALQLTDLKFLVMDLNEKLQVLTKEPIVSPLAKKVEEGLSVIQLVEPKKFITDCVRVMPRITNHIQSIQKYIEEILTSCDGIRDATNMYRPDITKAKQCLSLLLEFQTLTLSWTGFQHPANIELLRDGLRALVDPKFKSYKSLKSLIEEATSQVVKYLDSCLILSTGVNLVKLLEVLIKNSSEETPKDRLVDVSEKLLSMTWTNLTGTCESGAQYNYKIDFLVKMYFSKVDVDSVQRTISWMLEEVELLTSKGSTLQTFPSIQKSNFTLLYRGVGSALVMAARNQVDKSSNHLSLWRKIAIGLQGFTAIVKKQESRSNFVTLLRRSMELLKLFLAKGMPILEIKLKSHTEEVIEILRLLQQNTRYVQSVCCHSKVLGDDILMGLVPAIKSILEALLYRVKAALAANNCSSAFWLGNLKNKDIHGDEILSQTSQESSETADDDEDQLPSEEEHSPVDDDESQENLSSSDVF